MIDVAILVGGKGSRLNKITKKTPKPLIKIDKKKFLEHLLIKLARYKFKNIFLLCSYKKNLFYKFYNNKRIHKSIIKCIDEGKPKEFRLKEILDGIDPSKVIFESPRKSQQVFFLKKFGPETNLGNIHPADVISVETLRRGLRGDTMDDFFVIVDRHLKKQGRK